ncbi:MAG: sigma factor-like helix-turn-helix DNA-binding protein [Bacilli bacterium]
MDNRLYNINLYDYYSELLTEKQKNYFEDYYFNNLTLAEISENNEISRNAVHKQIKEAEKKINFYEEKLKLYEKSIKIKEIIKDYENKNKIEELI